MWSSQRPERARYVWVALADRTREVRGRTVEEDVQVHRAAARPHHASRDGGVARDIPRQELPLADETPAADAAPICHRASRPSGSPLTRCRRI